MLAHCLDTASGRTENFSISAAIHWLPCAMSDVEQKRLREIADSGLRFMSESPPISWLCSRWVGGTTK